MTMARRCADSERLIARARSGDVEARGLLLDQYRNDLKLFARAMVGRSLRQNLDSSDLVQQTLLEAHRDLLQFRGSGEAELISWLRAILIHNVAHQAQYGKRKRRGSKCPVSFEELLERSSLSNRLARFDPVESPSRQVIRREQAVLLADALARLPRDQRTALELHHLQGLTVPEVSRAMGRSLLSITGLLYRGTKALRRQLGASE